MVYSPDKNTGERIAIIIGCAKYDCPGLNDLQYAENDAKAIEDRLCNPEIGGFGKIFSFNSSSTLKDIELTIDQVLTDESTGRSGILSRFHLVQNPRKEQKKLEQWQCEINKLLEQNYHLTTLKMLQGEIKKYGDQPAPIVKKLSELKQKIEIDLCLKWRKYLARLNTDWSRGLISRELKELAELHVNGDPEFMFSDVLPDDTFTLDLRHHFNNDFTSEILNERWPPRA